jgi:hypothetical protein
MVWPDRLPGDPPPSQYGPGRKAVSDWNRFLDNLDRPIRPAGSEPGTASAHPDAPKPADLQREAGGIVRDWDAFLKGIDRHPPAPPASGVQKPRPQ